MIDALTGLRFYAALIVMLSHFSWGQRTDDSILVNIMQRGVLGVDIFFILSGFVLLHSNANLIANGRFFAAKFARNRFARLYPLHIAILALFVVAAFMSGGTLRPYGFAPVWQELPFHITLMHAWGTTNGLSWNFPSWSISAEVVAYLSFPLLARIILSQTRTRALALAFLFHFAVYGLLHVNGLEFHMMTNAPSLLRILTEFTLGMALWRFMDIWQGRMRAAALTTALTSALIIAAMAIQLNTVVFTPLFALLILAASGLGAGRFALLNSRPIVYLGEISYATYMVHIIVLIVVRWLTDTPSHIALGLIPAAVGVLCVYALSAVLYHAVEQPARKWLRMPK